MKRNIDILKKSFTSLRTPIKCLGEKVHIRDTSLLASAVSNKLSDIGKAHGIPKIELSQSQLENMDLLMKENPKLFYKYAIQDSYITLTHAVFMNDFSFGLGNMRNPNTLGSLSTKYITDKWRKDKYRGYQIDPKFPLGNAQTTHTPKGITAVGITGETLNMFLGSFRGGRNECFAYGIDTNTNWFDYDLTSCYSTIMSMCGDPDYIEDSGLNLNYGVEESFPSFVPLSDKVHRNKISDLRTSDSKNSCSSGVGLPTFLAAPSGSPSLEGLGEEEGGGLGGGSSSSSAVPIEISNFEEENKISEENLIQKDENGDSVSPDVLAMCGQPDYNKTKIITSELINDKKIDFTECYSALRVKFHFPNIFKFPPIPISTNDGNTVYPLSGEGLITGLEYISAKNILELYFNKYPSLDRKVYYIKIIYGVYIPFKTEIKDNEQVLSYFPFYEVINELQRFRRLHPKKSAMERIYKDLGNMLYGKVVSGISNKRSYDARHEMMTSMQGSQLTNPIIGS
jgi:hypothetical protein